MNCNLLTLDNLSYVVLNFFSTIYISRKNNNER